MPNAAEISLTEDASILLVGDSGTHKSFFIGTCPQPSYVFDFDNGMAIHRGRSDIDYDTFKEAPKDMKLQKEGKLGVYEYGTAWPAFLKKLNEIGASIDKGECKYKTIAFDSLTLMCDICISYILKSNNRSAMEQRDWGAFLNNMSTVFGQVTGWPLVKVGIAHVKRAENQLTEVEEKLPLIPGQFAGKVSVLFDEVYFTAFKMSVPSAGKKAQMIWYMNTVPTGVIRQAKSRRYNLPDESPTTWESIIKHIESLRK